MVDVEEMSEQRRQSEKRKQEFDEMLNRAQEVSRRRIANRFLWQ